MLAIVHLGPLQKIGHGAIELPDHDPGKELAPFEQRLAMLGFDQQGFRLLSFRGVQIGRARVISPVQPEPVIPLSVPFPESHSCFSPVLSAAIDCPTMTARDRAGTRFFFPTGGSSGRCRGSARSQAWPMRARV